MIPLARHHSGATLALLAVAALALGLHRAFAAHFDPCADPAQLLHLDAYGDRFTVSEHLGTGDWYPQQRVDGPLPPAVPRGSPLAFRMARAEAPYPIYSRSFLIVTVLPGDRNELRELRAGSEVLPAHRVFDDSLGEIRLTRYFLVQGVSPVAHLLPSGIASALPQLLHGTLPVTAFAVTGVADTETLSDVEAAEEAWLVAAWSDFRRACRP
jgi:hypothetical protein